MKVDSGERQPGRRANWWKRLPGGPGGIRRLGSFAVVGAISTAGFVVLYSVGRAGLGPQAANLLALSLTMLFNFVANRKYTFAATDGPLHVQGGQYLAVYGLGLAASSGMLHLGLQLTGEPGRAIETAIAVGAGAVATLIRFALLSVWVFRPPGADITGGIP